jgi:hypothetical protein
MRRSLVALFAVIQANAPAASAQSDLPPGTFLAVRVGSADTLRGIARYVSCGDTVNVTLASLGSRYLIEVLRIGRPEGAYRIARPGTDKTARAHTVAVSSMISSPDQDADSGLVHLRTLPDSQLVGTADIWTLRDVILSGQRLERLLVSFTATPVKRGNNTEFFGLACRP